MSEADKRARLTNGRKFIRKNVTDLSKSVLEFCELRKDDFSWSEEIEIKVSHWVEKAEYLNKDLLDLNDKYQATLGSSTEEDNWQKEFETCQGYSDKIIMVKLTLDVFCKRRQPQTVQPTGNEKSLMEVLTSLVQLQEKSLQKETMKEEQILGVHEDGTGMRSILERLVAMQEASSSGAAQLPTARLRRFGGNQQDFLVFIDEFRRLVHERSGFSDLQKHKILRDVLDGEAAKSINGIPLTEKNYEKALRYLIKRYGCVETVVFGIFTKMLELQKIHKVIELGPLRELLDKINNYIITLDSLDINKQFYSCIMYPVVLRTIPENLSLRFLSNINGKSKIEENIGEEEETDEQPLNLKISANGNLPKLFSSRFGELLDFLTQEIATRETQRALCPRDRKVGSSHSRFVEGRTQRPQGMEGGSANVYHSAAAGNKQQQTWQQQNATTGECIFCKGKHAAVNCNAKLTVDEKMRVLKGVRACWKCFRKDHSSRECEEKSCPVCKGPHHKSICFKIRSTTVKMVAVTKGLLPTGHARVVGVYKDSRVVRFLLDSGSQRTFITERLAKALQVKIIGHEWLYVHVFGGRAPTEAQRLPITNVNLLTRRGITVQLTALVIPEITADLLPTPSKELRHKLGYRDLAEEESGPAQLDLLLNAKDSFMVMEGKRVCIDNSTFVIGTKFGDVVVSEPDNSKRSAMVSVVSAPNLDRFWDLETLGVLPEELEKPNTMDEVVKSFKSGIQRLPDGNYQVKMNVKDNVGSLEENMNMASKQLKTLAMRLAKDPQLKEDYLREVRFFIDGEFAEPLPMGEKPRYIMPHFPVINPDKESYKVRPVFNASAAARGKLSLNDCIEDTPNLLPCPLKALTNFRRYKVALSGDISKAYLMVKVHPSHRNFLCFLWFEDEESLTGEKMFRMTATSFGVKDSQFNTIMVIREHAKQFVGIFPEAANRLENDLYMDDMLTGAQTPQEAQQIWEDITRILGEAGMTMKKFKSNNPGIRHKYGGSTEESEVLLKPAGITKVLGVSWDQDEDVLTFTADGMIEFVSKAPSTMRTLMGACARLYDPQGLLAPYTMCLKLILQEAHLSKAGLDGSLPEPLVKRWLDWCKGLKHLVHVRIPRWFNIGAHSIKQEVHAFCDSSERAYAAVIFLKTVSPDGEVTISLVASKAKLAPLKQLDMLTIPKKELMSAMLAARLVDKIKVYLKLEECPTFFWSDSQVTLHWIYSNCPAKWGVFVKNRLTEILQRTMASQWGHCSGKDNPADLPSRGLPMNKLIKNTLWLKGPQFISGKDSDYPVFKENPQVREELPEARVLHVVVIEPVVNPAKFSSLNRLVRVFAWVKRAVIQFKGLTGKAPSPVTGKLTDEELEMAKKHLLCDAQSRFLGESKALLVNEERLKDSEVAAFQPFLDESGLVRVGGRLHFADEPYDVRHPILLKDDPLTRLIIMDVHQRRCMHMKTDAVLNQLREEFWIIRMRQIVKSVIFKCGGCLRDGAKLAGAEEAPLPPNRTEMTFKPFKTTGLDYMGPMVIRTESGEKKVWVALFTCAVVRAVHLEVVEDLSTSSCLSAIRRFSAAHGLPAVIVSDNALAFKKASKCLSGLFNSLKSEMVQNFFGQSGIVWDFNVARAPWWGGFFERMVGLTKACLRKSMKSHKWSLTNFITILHEIAAIINQRPLTSVPSNVDNLRALSPAQFLSPQVPLTFPAGQIVSLGNKPDALVKVWKRREQILNSFWKRWRSEYMLVLRTALRRKGADGDALAAGDVVILQQDNAPRAFWKLGRIDEILSSRDGKPRAYKVHLGRGQYVNRAGRLLARLL